MLGTPVTLENWWGMFLDVLGHTRKLTLFSIVVNFRAGLFLVVLGHTRKLTLVKMYGPHTSNVVKFGGGLFLDVLGHTVFRCAT